MESLEVKLARVEEKVDQVLRRLEAGDKRFVELDERVSVLEQRIAMVWGGLVLASVVIPLAVRYLMGG